MIKNEDGFKKLIGQLDIDSEPNPAHRENLRRQMLSVFNETASQRIIPWQTLGKTIMKNRITKFAAAAAIFVFISLFSISILTKRSSTEVDTSPRYILPNVQNNQLYLKEMIPCNVLPVVPN